MKTLVLTALLLGGTAAPAVAQEAKPGGPATPEEAAASARTPAEPGPGPIRYDFEDDLVEGDLQRPDGELVESIQKARQASLIEIRQNFIPEIVKSMEDLE